MLIIGVVDRDWKTDERGVFGMCIPCERSFCVVMRLKERMEEKEVGCPAKGIHRTVGTPLRTLTLWNEPETLIYVENLEEFVEGHDLRKTCWSFSSRHADERFLRYQWEWQWGENEGDKWSIHKNAHIAVRLHRRRLSDTGNSVFSGEEFRSFLWSRFICPLWIAQVHHRIIQIMFEYSNIENIFPRERSKISNILIFAFLCLRISKYWRMPVTWVILERSIIHHF